jgi:two-component system, OmpR family, response regulator
MSKDRRVRLFSALEAAALCGVVNQTTINWIKSGHLKAFMTPGGQYRIYAEDLLNFLEERKMRVPEELLAEHVAELDPNLVLIVDDDRDLNQILKRILEKKLPGIDAEQAFDGFEAGKKISELKPALIFLDYDLPGIDGASLCQRIRSDPSIGKPSIISMTGLDTADIKASLLGAGADDFFPKPLDFEGLCARARELLAAKAGKTQS